MRLSGISFACLAILLFGFFGFHSNSYAVGPDDNAACLSGPKVEKLVEMFEELNRIVKLSGPDGKMEADRLSGAYVEMIKRERKLSQDYPCFIDDVDAQFCDVFKKSLQSYGLSESLVRCRMTEDGKHAKIFFLGDSLINTQLFSGWVKYCYKIDSYSKKFDEPYLLRVKMASAELDKLLSDASTYLRAFRPPTPIETAIEKDHFPNRFRNKDTAFMLQELLKGHTDVVIGESHSALSAKKAIIDNMQIIKNQGAVLALEHIFHEPYQSLLDSYIFGTSQIMDPRLKLYLETLDQGHMLAPADFSYGFTAIVKAAKAFQVRVIAAETETSYLAGREEGFAGAAAGSKRYKAMNYVNKLIVSHERKGSKVVHFVGSAHVHTRSGVLGVSELMGAAPTLVISDISCFSDEIPQRSVQFGVDEGEEGVKADIHIQEPTCSVEEYFEAKLFSISSNSLDFYLDTVHGYERNILEYEKTGNDYMRDSHKSGIVEELNSCKGAFQNIERTLMTAEKVIPALKNQEQARIQIQDKLKILKGLKSKLNQVLKFHNQTELPEE